MYWDADNVNYREVSMDAAYSGSTLIWAKQKAVLVTATTQITSTGTYILAYPFTEEAAAGSAKGLKTVSGNTSHMYVSWVPVYGTNTIFVPGDALRYKIVSAGTSGWYRMQDISTNDYLAYYDSTNVVGITYPYLSSGVTKTSFQLTKSVDHHSTGHIKDLEGYTIRFTNGNSIWKYPAGANSPEEFVYRVATAAGQQIAMLYKIQ